MTFSTAEKIETIWETRADGVFGSYHPVTDRTAIICLREGRAFSVRMTATGFDVREHKSDFVGSAETVLEAAHLATNP